MLARALAGHLGRARRTGARAYAQHVTPLVDPNADMTCPSYGEKAELGEISGNPTNFLGRTVCHLSPSAFPPPFLLRRCPCPHISTVHASCGLQHLTLRPSRFASWRRLGRRASRGREGRSARKQRALSGGSSLRQGRSALPSVDLNCMLSACIRMSGWATLLRCSQSSNEAVRCLCKHFASPFMIPVQPGPAHRGEAQIVAEHPVRS